MYALICPGDVRLGKARRLKLYKRKLASRTYAGMRVHVFI